MTPEEILNLLRAIAQQAEHIAALRAEVARLATENASLRAESPDAPPRF